MTLQQSDPWAIPEPGFEKYQGSKAADGFQPMDTQATDLSTFLREEMQAMSRQARKIEPPMGAVTLPDGTPAQLTQKSPETWELMLHVRRDFYEVFNARTRDEVLRMAEAAMRRRTAP